MSHPLIVDAAEALFVPVAIYNNTTGDADAAIRQRFDERAWNNPVVRVMNPKGEDLAPKLHRDWSRARTLELMIAGLRAVDVTPPPWLSEFTRAERAHERGVETAVFGMT